MRSTMVIVFTVFPIILMGQSSNYSSTLQACGGYVEDGFGITASYDYYTGRDQYAQLTIGFDLANDLESGYKIPYAILKVQPSYWLEVWEGEPVSMPISMNLGLGGLFGYIDINGGEESLPSGVLLTANSRFTYGGFIGIELEYHYSNSFSFLLRASENFYLNNELGQFQPYFAGGIKYYLF